METYSPSDASITERNFRIRQHLLALEVLRNRGGLLTMAEALVIAADLIRRGVKPEVRGDLLV